MVTPDFSHRVQHGWQRARLARHSARVPRYLAIAVLLVFLILGVRSAFFAPTAATAPTQPSAGADAPSRDLALQFARAYLTYDTARPGLRQPALAPYIGSALEPGAGLIPRRGSQRVLWVDVASDQPALQGGRTVTVAAGVTTQALPLYLAVTVDHPHGGSVRLVGYPSLVGAPELAAPDPTPPRESVDDPEISTVVDRVLRNYLSLAAPDLEADLAPDAHVTLPTRRLHLEEVSELSWLGGSGAVLATLAATDRNGTAYTLTYELGLAYRDRPYVAFIEVVPTDT